MTREENIKISYLWGNEKLAVMDMRYQILKRQMPMQKLFFFSKSEVLYQMTCVFCQRFMPVDGDEGLEQMRHSVKVGMKNIIDGIEYRSASVEECIKLLKDAEASVQELRKGFEGYLVSRGLSVWGSSHAKYLSMKEYCRSHSEVEDYKQYFEKWTDEEMANTALTFCYMTDSLLRRHLTKLEADLLAQEKAKESVASNRVEGANGIEKELERLRKENERLKKLLREYGISIK